MLLLLLAVQTLSVDTTRSTLVVKVFKSGLASAALHDHFVSPETWNGTLQLDPDKLQAIRDGLFLVVNGAGTGHNAQIKGYDVSGKTGTAQVISNQGKEKAGKTEKDLRDNGWFVFFAPRDKPEIAGVVFLEHGVHGSNAALIAHHLMDTFFAKKEGRPLPGKPEFKPNLVP